MRRALLVAPLVSFFVASAFAESSSPHLNPESTEKNEFSLDGTAEEKTWGAFDPGKGFLVGQNSFGSLSISAYALVRYINQLPASQSFTDHLGNVRSIDTRRDFQIHRVMIWLKGFMYDPKLTYALLIWGLNSTNDTAIVGSMNYEFSKRLTFGGGIEGLPSIRSLTGQHPYFLGTDRQMGEEFFKPSFTSGVWIRGEAFPKLNYRLMIGDNLSQVGINAAQMTRDLAVGASVWWLPSTGEFGPRGGFGDYEMHEKLATRLGMSYAYSREDKQSPPGSTESENTQVRLSDGLLLFNPGSLAPGVTVNKADYRLLSLDSGMKYRGFFLHGEYYMRWLDHFHASGPIPQDKMFDHGLEVSAAHQILPKKFELFASTSYLFGYFNRSWEALLGGNYYPFDSRNFRLNTSLTHIEHSPTGSLFGYYVSGQTGTIVNVGADLFF